MRAWPGIICLTFALASAASAKEDAVLTLEPTSEWVLDYAGERCSLYRAYGQGEDALALRIDSFGSATDYRIMVTGPAVPEVRFPTSEMTFRFTPDSEERRIEGLHGKVGDEPAAAFSASFVPYENPEIYERMAAAERLARAAEPRKPEPEFERLVRSIQIDFARGRTLLLNLGSMAKPLAAMRDCLNDLHISWGIDPAVHQNLTRLAVPKPSTVRRVQRNYPSSMLRSGISAHIPVRIMVDAQGETTACVIQAEQSERDFKEAVCGNLAKGYEPALDSDGRAVASVYQTSVLYMIR